MKSTLPLRGMEWGKIGFQRDIIQYGLAPNEQKLFTGYFTRVIPNTLRRIKAQAVYVGVPLFIGLYVYTSVEAAHTAMTRKQLADYADEK